MKLVQLIIDPLDIIVRIHKSGRERTSQLLRISIDSCLNPKALNHFPRNHRYHHHSFSRPGQTAFPCAVSMSIAQLIRRSVHAARCTLHTVRSTCPLFTRFPSKDFAATPSPPVPSSQRPTFRLTARIVFVSRNAEIRYT